MNILEVLSVQIPCIPCGQVYEVPLNDILLSHQMLEQGCPVEDERECPPLFQTRLVSHDVLRDFVEAWNRLEDSVRKDNGVLVSASREAQCQGSSTMPQRSIQREPKISPENGSARSLRALPDVASCESTRLHVVVDARDRGLDETLSETFPCSDALSSIPDPPVWASSRTESRELGRGSRR